MPDIHVETTAETGYDTRSTIDDHEVDIDAGGPSAPSPVEMLVTAYTSCFLASFRAAAKRNGVRDPGRIDVDADAWRDDDDRLDAISFTVSVEAELDDAAGVVDDAREECHVDASLKQSVQAEVTVEDDAF